MHDWPYDVQPTRKDGKPYTPDKRKLKRGTNRLDLWNAVEEAFYMGLAHFNEGRPYRNPYPAGLRHDAYERGFK